VPLQKTKQGVTIKTMAQKQHDDPVLRLQIPLSNGFLGESDD